MKTSPGWAVLASCGACGIVVALLVGLLLEPPGQRGGDGGVGVAAPSIVAMAAPRRAPLPNDQKTDGSWLAERRPPSDAIRERHQAAYASQVTQDQQPASPDTAAVVEALQRFTQAVEAAGPRTPFGGNPGPEQPLNEPAGEELPAAEAIEPLDERQPPRIERVPGRPEGDGHLVIHIQDEDLRQVLTLLSEQGGLNILAGPSVQGKVTATLNDVSVEAALDAILKSTGFIARREGQFIYVGTGEEFEAMRQSLDRIATRVYRPDFVTAADLQALVSPLLTPTIGKISVTAPAEIGIESDTSTVGGNTLAGSEAVLVQDYEAVLAEIDQIVGEIDRRPAQVAIEALILSVKLNDQNQCGVDFQLLRDRSHVRFGLGDPRTQPLAGGGQVDPVTGGTIGEFAFDGGGMKFAFLDDSLGAFLTALESVGDTNVVAHPHVLCLNKQRAEILIGAQLGYISTTLTSTSTSQNVNFLEVGAQLRIRPFISSNGMIRMEIHPELSTGSVRVEQGFTLPDKEVTQVTTNIMVRDGCTVIIGGLMREDLSTSANQIPFMGSLPVVGPLFRNKTENIDKREIMVLVTPRIVCDPATCIEGATEAAAFFERQAAVADAMSPLGKRYLGRKNLRKAQQSLRDGDHERAILFVNRAIHFDPLNREALELRRSLVGGSAHPEVVVEAPVDAGGHPLEGDSMAPWLLDELESPSGNSSGQVPQRPASHRKTAQDPQPRKLQPTLAPAAASGPAIPVQRSGDLDARR